MNKKNSNSLRLLFEFFLLRGQYNPSKRLSQGFKCQRALTRIKSAVILFVSDFFDYRPQHCLYFLPLPQGQGSFLPTFGIVLRTVMLSPCDLWFVALFTACLLAISPLKLERAAFWEFTAADCCAKLELLSLC